MPWISSESDPCRWCGCAVVAGRCGNCGSLRSAVTDERLSNGRVRGYGRPWHPRLLEYCGCYGDVDCRRCRGSALVLTNSVHDPISHWIPDDPPEPDCVDAAARRRRTR